MGLGKVLPPRDSKRSIDNHVILCKISINQRGRCTGVVDIELIGACLAISGRASNKDIGIAYVAIAGIGPQECVPIAYAVRMACVVSQRGVLVAGGGVRKRRSSAGGVLVARGVAE